MKWKLTQYALEVEGREAIKRKPADAEALRAFAASVAVAREVAGTLMQARRAFWMGRADYRDAAANLRALIEECAAAQDELERESNRIDQFFEEPVTPLFADDDGSGQAALIDQLTE